MGKEDIKRMVNEFIDSMDEITDFSISAEMEEIDTRTLDGGGNKVQTPTGLSTVMITAFKG